MSHGYCDTCDYACQLGSDPFLCRLSDAGLSDWKLHLDPAADCGRVTGKSEVMPGTDSQRRWPEDGFGGITIDLLQARLWKASDGDVGIWLLWDLIRLAHP